MFYLSILNKYKKNSINFTHLCKRVFIYGLNVNETEITIPISSAFFIRTLVINKKINFKKILKL